MFRVRLRNPRTYTENSGVISLAGVQMERNQVNRSGTQDQSSPLFSMEKLLKVSVPVINLLTFNSKSNLCCPSL